MSAATILPRAHAHPPHMIAAKNDCHQDRQQQTPGGPVTVRYMATRKIRDGRQSVQNATAIPFDARVQNVFPMIPGYGRCYAAHETAGDDQRIEDGQQLLLVVGRSVGHNRIYVDGVLTAICKIK